MTYLKHNLAEKVIPKKEPKVPKTEPRVPKMELPFNRQELAAIDTLKTFVSPKEWAGELEVSASLIRRWINREKRIPKRRIKEIFVKEKGYMDAFRRVDEIIRECLEANYGSHNNGERY